MAGKKPRFFFRRSQKVIVPARDKQIIIPFRGFSLLAIFVLLVTSIYLIFRSDLFLVHQVRVLGETKDCVTEDEIVKNLDVLGRSLVFLDREKTRSKLQSSITCIGEAIIKKKWPDKVQVEISQRKGAALLTKIRSRVRQEATASAQATLSADLKDSATPSASGIVGEAPSSGVDFFLADGNGFIFKKVASSSSYPRVDIEKEVNLKIGTKIQDGAVLATISFLEISPSFNFKVTDARVDQQDRITLSLDEGTQIILTKDKDVKNQAASLQAIIKQAKIEGAKIKSVDFTFDKPVLQVVKERT